MNDEAQRTADATFWRVILTSLMKPLTTSERNKVLAAGFYLEVHQNELRASIKKPQERKAAWNLCDPTSIDKVASWFEEARQRL